MLVLLIAASLVSPVGYASRYTRHRKYKAPPTMAKLAVTVLKAEDGKPLQNAAVVFHLTSQGSKNEGNMELKTNEQGKATLSIVPLGSDVLVQVIAQGYRTFGHAYNVPTTERSITIKMLPPDQQYSIYTQYNPNSDVHDNAPKTQMGHAEPADSPLLTPPPKSN
jgi:hypothetical protein